MTFAWPWLLATLLALPLMVAGYARLVRRRDARRAELARLGLVAGDPPALLRHLPPALLLGALAVALVAVARPEATVTEPRREGTVVLAFDTSASMAATDIAPTRMAAAKAAAHAFVARQPSTILIGVVSFGAVGFIAQQPTSDRQSVTAAIDRLIPQGGTSLARGIQTSLSAVAGRTVQLNRNGTADGADPGYHGSAAVILLSDGENTDGPDPAAAAGLASTAGVRVYPVGLGSPAGSVLQIDGFQLATQLDEPVLRKIAATTNGAYFAAADEASLARVYSSIDLHWKTVTRHDEVTGAFAAVAALLLLAGAALSIAWFGRVI